MLTSRKTYLLFELILALALVVASSAVFYPATTSIASYYDQSVSRVQEVYALVFLVKLISIPIIIVLSSYVSRLMILFYGGWNGIGAVISGAMTVLKEAFSLVFWVLIIRAILSWVAQGYNPVAAVFDQLTEPMLRPIRKVIPPLGGLDLSILVLLIGMQFLQILVMDLLR